MTRYFVWQLSIAMSLYFGVLLVLEGVSKNTLIPLCIFFALSVVGVIDQLQKKHAILRNYPIIGHLRFWLEFKIGRAHV